MDRERLYRRLPRFLQNLAVSVEGWRIQRFRHGGSFPRLFAEYRERTFRSSDEIREFRDRRLREFVRHAATTVPYYRRRFREEGIDPDTIRGLEDLSRIPVLDRGTVQASPRDFVSEAVPASRCMTSHTSGTTGAGLRFPVTFDAHREQWAVWWRYRGWHGIGFRRPCLYFGGRSVVPLEQREPPYWRHNVPGRQRLFSGYHLGVETAPSYLEEMCRHPGAWVHGYPSLVSLLAGYAIQFEIRPEIEVVTVGAESLLPAQAETIRRGFGVCPVQNYGMAEGAANLSCCPDGALHVDEDYAAVEFQPVGEGHFRILGTNFSNPAFPLLRYDTGDVSGAVGETCGCGRPGRVVSSVDGRKEDFVVTRSGAYLGRLDHVFKDLVNVREAQIRQAERGRMTVVVVRGPAYGEQDERLLRDEILQRVGDDVAFEIEYAERIPRTRTGKIRFVVSSLEEGRLAQPGTGPHE